MENSEVIYRSPKHFFPKKYTQGTLVIGPFKLTMGQASHKVFTPPGHPLSFDKHSNVDNGKSFPCMNISIFFFSWSNRHWRLFLSIYLCRGPSNVPILSHFSVIPNAPEVLISAAGNSLSQAFPVV